MEEVNLKTDSEISEKNRENKFKARNSLIDNFRGIALIFYILSQVATSYFAYLPVWMPHDAAANGIWSTNLGFLDFGPVMFYFIIGLTTVMSFKKNVAKIGKKAAYQHLLYRNFVLIGIDAIISFFINKYLYPVDWNIIRSVGLVGIFMLPFINKNTVFRAASAFIILFLYQFYRVRIFNLMDGTEGGIAACFGFITVVLFVSVLKDLYDKNLLYYVLGLLVISLCAFISNQFIPIVFREFNSTYLLATLSFFGLAFLVFALIDRLIISKPIPIIAWLGQSIIFFFLIACSTQLYIRRLFPPINLNSYIKAAVFTILICITLATFLRSRKIIIKL